MTSKPDTSSEQTGATMAADQLFWCVAEMPSTKHVRSGALVPGLLPSLEDEIPVPLDDVHAVCTRVDDRRVLICACPKSSLAQAAPGVMSLTPDVIPPALGVVASPSELNLLVGTFEPAALRAARGRRQAVVLLALCMAILLAAIGLFRRAEYASRREAEAKATIASILAERTFDRRDATLFELRDEHRAARALIARVPKSPDAPVMLQECIRVWPTETVAKIQTLTIAPESASIGVAIDGDPAPLLDKLKSPPGFMLEEPRLNTSGAFTRIALVFRKRGSAQEATP